MRKTTGQWAFSLVELLAVMAVAILAVGLAAPAYQSVTQSSNLMISGSLVADELTLARNLSLAHGRNVEVRFYRNQDSGEYRALRVHLEQPDGQMAPVRRLLRLADGIVVDGTAAFSPLLKTAPQISGTEASVQGIGSPAPFEGMRFRPSGAIDIDADPTDTFFTLRAETDTAVRNSAILQINPSTGRTQIYRP